MTTRGRIVITVITVVAALLALATVAVAASGPRRDDGPTRNTERTEVRDRTPAGTTDEPAQVRTRTGERALLRVQDPIAEPRRGQTRQQTREQVREQSPEHAATPTDEPLQDRARIQDRDGDGDGAPDRDRSQDQVHLRLRDPAAH